MRAASGGKRWTALVLAIVMTTAVLPATLADDGDSATDAPLRGPSWIGEPFEDRLIVGYDDPLSLDREVLSQLASEHDGDLVRVDDRLGFAVVQVPDGGQPGFVEQASQLPGVHYVEPDTEVTASFVPNDSFYESHQWGPPAIGMEQAWDSGRGSHDVSVAVIDTGVDYTHEDLAANVCTLGKDYANDDDDPMDDHGHGTHVAGTVAAEINNGIGVAGMANACLHAIKVLGADGSGSSADTASAIVDAAQAGAEIISLSLGGPPGLDRGSTQANAVAFAYANGSLVVGAAGNDDCKPVGFPASYPETVAVGSLDEPGDTRSSFSNCGHALELAAPGADIASTVPGDSYASSSGTSMATPHVSGVAALIWDQNPGLTNVEIRCILRQTADDLGPSGHDIEHGFGRIDADEAITIPTPDPGCVDDLAPPFEPPCPLPCVEDLSDGRAQHIRTTSIWHVSSTCDTPPTGSHYLGFTRATSCTYDWGSRARGFADLTVDLTSVTTSNLSFSHRIDEDPASDTEALYLTYSTDDGSSWYILDDFSDTTQQPWTDEFYDVSYLTGQMVTFRWWFDSLDGTDNDHLGWLIDDILVDGNEPPDASFTFDPSDPTTADEIGFTDTSADPDGSIVDWAWRFGDSSNSSDQHPTHTYADDGTYTVCLTVTDDAGAQDTDCTPIEVANVAPSPGFTASPLPATTIEPITFTDTSSDPDGSIAARSWSFGDGGTSTDAAPEHRYADGGTYEACLEVTDDDGALAQTCQEVEVIPVVMHGRAIGIEATLPTGEATLADTGEVRSEEEQTVTRRAIELDAGPLEASGSRATVTTDVGSSEANAEIGQITLQLSGNVLEIDGLEARSLVTCDDASASTLVSSITVNGVPVTIPGQEPPEGTTVALPGGGEIVLNEQTDTPDGLSVTGVTLVHGAVGELHLAQASAGISPCPSGVR